MIDDTKTQVYAKCHTEDVNLTRNTHASMQWRHYDIYQTTLLQVYLFIDLNFHIFVQLFTRFAVDVDKVLTVCKCSLNSKPPGELSASRIR